jgi:membrane-associated phospholipid phosphatase
LVHTLSSRECVTLEAIMMSDRPFPPSAQLRASGSRLGKSMLVPAVALVALSVLAWHGHVTAIDRTLTGDVVQGSGSTGFRLGEAISTIGSGGVVALLAVLIAALVWRRTGDIIRALAIPFAGAVAGVAELIGKQIVGRLRPVTAAATGESGLGFPSGHTTGFTAAAVAVVLVLAASGMVRGRRTGMAWGIAAVLSVVVGIGRVLVGAHYVFDILAGLALGVLCAQLALFLADMVGPMLAERIRRVWLGRSRA